MILFIFEIGCSNFTEARGFFLFLYVLTDGNQILASSRHKLSLGGDQVCITTRRYLKVKIVNQIQSRFYSLNFEIYKAHIRLDWLQISYFVNIKRLVLLVFEMHQERVSCTLMLQGCEILRIRAVLLVVWCLR